MPFKANEDRHANDGSIENGKFSNRPSVKKVQDSKIIESC